MSKQIVLKPSLKAIDYVMVEFMASGEKVGSYGSTIQRIKKTIDSGFFGTQGQRAMDAYIELHGKEAIKDAILKRVMAKNNIDL